MKNLPIVLIDVDSVLANFNKAIFYVLKTNFNVNIEAIDLHTPIWDIMNLPNLVHLKNQLWELLESNNGFVYKIEKYNYADNLVSKLRKISQLIACTSSIQKGSFASERSNWLMDK